MSEEQRCSFCSRVRANGEAFIKSLKTNAFICGPCVALATAEALPLAHCHACAVVDGKHAPTCLERSSA